MVKVSPLTQRQLARQVLLRMALEDSGRSMQHPRSIYERFVFVKPYHAVTGPKIMMN